MTPKLKHLTPEELAERWSVKEGTLANWRVRSYGPKFLKLGGLIRYPLNEVERWEKLEMRAGTTEEQTK